MTREDLLSKLLTLDRRIIYTLLFVCVVAPFYLNWPHIKVEVSKPVQDAYDVINAIPPDGNPLMLSFDYDPASAAELTPMAEAVLRHCFARRIRVLGISLQYTGQGAGIAAEVMPRIAREFGREQNIDWAFMGFQPNAAVAMLQMGEDFKKTFPEDYYKTPVDQIPLAEGIQNYDQIPAVLTLAGTAVGEYWAVYPGMRYGVTVLAGLTAVYVADIQPFYQSHQIKGIIGGLKGSAEYEKLVNHPGSGTAGMRSQKVVHYMIILFIVLGNIAYLATRGRSR
jgi:hypothetical protein